VSVCRARYGRILRPLSRYKEVIQMAKVSIEVHDGTARFRVAVLAQSVRQALSIVATRYPESVVRVKFPIDPEGFFVEDSAA
jgi:hypothetical protein